MIRQILKYGLAAGVYTLVLLNFGCSGTGRNGGDDKENTGPDTQVGVKDDETTTGGSSTPDDESNIFNNNKNYYIQ